MANETAKKFIDALHKLEAERDLETIVGLFGEDCEINNVVTVDNDNQKTDARKFWQAYRDNFGEVKSTFRNEIITENRAALEWTTTGTSSEGNQFEYEGVSILEIDGERITRFFAYFDPNKLGRQIVEEKGQTA
ncbi:MAG: nuclear transport factor 2 family protein [Acidobacteria bacterium]|nr:nuclear transport factor 2 family protein [Acidobacteriota bacterium]MCA1637848.1 nuclear transport factor 2 family protein [Acidobacteriota bacterium]